MWLLSCVGLALSLQASLLVESSVTHGAGEWYFFCVGQVGFLQVVPSHIGLATFGACIWSCSGLEIGSGHLPGLSVDSLGSVLSISVSDPGLG